MTFKSNRAVEAQGNNETGDDDSRLSKIRRTSSSCITILPDDCLNLIFKRLTTKDDRDSFGLTCGQWLHIQNNNHESLWLWYRCYHNYPGYVFPKFSPECFPKILCKLFTRFQNLKALSKVSPGDNRCCYLCLDRCSKYSDTELSLMFSWLPRLTTVCLMECGISDGGLEALAKCCSSLKIVNLSLCCSITDSGISFLIQNCPELHSLHVPSCSNITGIGFLGCRKTLTYINAGGCKHIPEGIKAIVSGGGVESPDFSIFSGVGEGCINSEAVKTISKGSPLLRELRIMNCVEVELEGWEAIGLNCTNLECLIAFGCRNLCKLGLQALCNGCNKLSRLYIDDDNNCSSFAVELFKRKKPDAMICFG
ncbi:hypothetical protein MKW98_030136 [Papaver atlanticum]|uniref:Uncharacterized protein n=1 Tax=Papaver atlanticum TaxID=357466 RepID=A0AAD4XSS2_9MAGN|nr:hypothetical protein MKW98_030136 [Papaver atlanticum]